MPKQLTIDNPTGAETPLDLSKQVNSGGGLVGAAGVATYYPLQGGAVGSTTINLWATNEPIAGLIKTLVLSSDGAPGGGQSLQATLYKNGSPTALTCTITGGASTFATDGSNSVAFTATDQLVLELINSAGSAVTRANWGTLTIIP